VDPADVWLATTDADTLIPPSRLRQQAHYAGRGWDAVAGTIRVTDWTGLHPRAISRFREHYDRGHGRIPTCTAPTWASAPRPT
jgi:hypothetical protein